MKPSGKLPKLPCPRVSPSATPRNSANVPSVTISGGIFVDTDNDDQGDAPINIVTLTLCTDLNGDGDSADAGEGPVDGDPVAAGVQAYTIITTDGTYAFTGLAPGSYVVKETQPSGYLTVTDLDSATPDAAGSPADAANASITDNMIAVTVMAGESDSGNDFIEEPAAAITGALGLARAA